jgi:hypothetical protein
LTRPEAAGAVPDEGEDAGGVGEGLGFPDADAGGALLGSRRFGGGVRSGSGVAGARGSRVDASAALMGRARGGS